MSTIKHSLVGYDRVTDRVAEEIDVPSAALPKAKKIASVPADDAGAIMCYPLDARAASVLAALLGATIDTDRRDYFLEGFEDAVIPSVGGASGAESGR